MQTSSIAKFCLFASVLALSACDTAGNFAGVGIGGSSPLVGGGGGGSGSGGGGGGTTTIEPVMQYGPGQTPGFGAVQISGDAQEIVFVDDANPVGANAGEEWQLFSVRIGTGVVTQITDGSPTAVPELFDFDLTDNGDFVVWASSDDFAGTNPSNQLNIFMASTSGAGITQVTSIDSGSAFNPQVSGNGKVVFLSFSDLTGDNVAGDLQIFSINTDGTGLAQLTMDALLPENLSLADDGNKIAFEGRGDPVGANADGSREIFVMDINGTNIRQITDSSGDSLSPKLSDNGSKVAFTSAAEFVAGGNSDGNYDVYVAQTDGSAIIRITDDGENAGTYSDGTPGDLAISGNGAYVVFGARGNLTGQNSISSTVFWAATDGSTIGQFLRLGTVPDSVAANDFYDAETVSVINDGSGVAFVSTVNYTSADVPTFDKIYTTARL